MQTLTAIAAKLALAQLLAAFFIAGLLLAHAALARRPEAGWTRS